ncbi:TetR/AcrR family transcriptional regulator [Sphaerisporangium fuscum]|uniref:TetR/AcrR family transcriptional regulator n=1 Tax=Sphaerisporangium fuscum TaxID=2835868 RepID=UPI001BDC664E|nr:TetR/AcrR family transcriptional regulator [Sphaerisporangium fuscum]
MSENSGPELPHTLEVLWGRSKRRARGPAQALSLERIVSAAIDIADEEGLQALSMARLAERLGCGTMSLYRHVANKDELQTFMLDAVPSLPPGIDCAEGWRAGLSLWATALLAVYHEHPWVLQITGGPPLEPGQLAWLDAGLRTLDGTPLHPREKMQVIMLVLHYVRGETQLTTAAAAAGEGPGEYGPLLARLVTAERFPALAEAITAGVFSEHPEEDPATDTRFGLDRILDGVEALIRQR